jgi:DNA-binding NtrC family response regulator
MARILIIDDEELVRETFRQALASDGHDIFLASNGLEGLRVLTQARPDLVITDILMPEKEGVETIIEIRKLHPELKIIAISGGGRVGNMDFLSVAERFGANLILSKPIHIDRLCDAVKTVLATRYPATQKSS